MRLKVSQITQTENKHDDNNRERGIRGLRPLDSLFILKKKEAETASEVAPVYTHSCGKRLKIVCEVAQPICLVLDFIFRFFVYYFGAARNRKTNYKTTFRHRHSGKVRLRFCEQIEENT